jgi:hypothetical protein
MQGSDVRRAAGRALFVGSVSLANVTVPAVPNGRARRRKGLLGGSWVVRGRGRLAVLSRRGPARRGT